MLRRSLIRNITSWFSLNRYYVVAAGVQLLLFPFGHWYDTRIFFGTGAGVAHGLSPYGQYDLIDYYSYPSLVGVVSGIGYPPPWALFLGAIYSVLYVPTENPLLMNLAMKVPIIFGNVLLARFVGSALRNHGSDGITSARAELLVLFNPFLIYTSTFWNMFDTLVVYLMLVGLHLLSKDKPLEAGLALGISIALKQLALPLIPLGWIWIARRPLPSLSRLQNLSIFTSALLGVAIGLVFAPFYLFGWSVSGFWAAVGYQTIATGGFTLYNTIPVDLSAPGLLSVLGYVPLVAAASIYVILRNKQLRDFRDLAQFALLVFIAFMTTRTFLAEQNLAVIFPLILIPELLGGRGFVEANRFWILFLVYTLFNSVPIQFAFFLFPDAFNLTVAITTSFPFSAIRFWILFGCAVLWLLLGWSYLLRRL